MRVLVVDDDPAVRESLRRALAFEGYDVELATEFLLAELFLRHPRQVLTRSQIFEAVWDYDFGPRSNSLEVAHADGTRDTGIFDGAGPISGSGPVCVLRSVSAETPAGIRRRSPATRPLQTRCNRRLLRRKGVSAETRIRDGPAGPPGPIAWDRGVRRRNRRHGQHAGLVVLALGLAAVVLALVHAEQWGWGSAKTLGALIGGIAGLGVFWVIEHRVESPIVEFPLFRNRPYLGATAAAFAAVGAYWTLMFYEPQYLQNILGYPSTEAGLLILPVTVPMIVISPAAGRLIAAFGTRATMGTGMVLALAGLVVLTTIDADSGYGRLFPGLMLLGLALGLVYAPMSSAAMAAMPKAKAGIASGVLAMNRVLAGAVCLALVGAVYSSRCRPTSWGARSRPASRRSRSPSAPTSRASSPARSRRASRSPSFRPAPPRG